MIGVVVSCDHQGCTKSWTRRKGCVVGWFRDPKVLHHEIKYANSIRIRDRGTRGPGAAFILLPLWMLVWSLHVS